MAVLTKQEKLFELFKDGAYHKTAEIFKVGSFGGLRRLQELRIAFRQGKYPGFADVERRRIHKSRQFEYRFVKGGAEPRISNESAVDRESKIVERKQGLAINVFSRGGRRI
jgi:hypothetical protein